MKFRSIILGLDFLETAAKHNHFPGLTRMKPPPAPHRRKIRGPASLPPKALITGRIHRRTMAFTKRLYSEHNNRSTREPTFL